LDRRHPAPRALSQHYPWVPHSCTVINIAVVRVAFQALLEDLMQESLKVVAISGLRVQAPQGSGGTAATWGKQKDVHSWFSDDGSLATRASYLNSAPSKTCAPSMQSSGLVYSLGLCEMPFRLGTNIMPVGTTLLVQAES
jgi:hypothetical protein